MDPAQLTKFAELLAALSSQDNETRRAAEAQYNATRTNDPNLFVFALLSVTAGEYPAHVKQQGAVLLRQTFRCTRTDFLWPKLSVEAQTFTKSTLLRLVETERSSSNLYAVCNAAGELGSYLLAGDQQPGWSELLPKLFSLVTSPDALHKEASLRILIEVIGVVGSVLLKGDSKSAVQNVLSSCLANSNPASVRVQAALLLCRIVQDLPATHWKPVQSQGGAVFAAARQLCSEGKEEEAQEILRALADVAETDPAFVKPFFTDAVNAGLQIAGERNLESSTRGIALEVVCVFAEQKGKLMVKTVPGVVNSCMRVCMNMLLELEDEDVAGWSTRFADNDEEQEEEEMYDVGLNCIDRFAKVFGSEIVLPVVFQAVGEFAASNRWQGKVAAIMTLNQIAEIVVENTHADEIVKLLLRFIQDPHQRVRYAAIHALGQVASDCSPHVEETWHAEVLPALCQAMDDPIPRVGSHACSAFVNFGEESDLDALLPHVDVLMTKLFPRMQKGQARQVRQESVTAVAVIAAKIEGGFQKFYGWVMPVLKSIVAECTGQDERILRGKAFECLSLLGTAVGKEAFRADAREAMNAVLHLQASNQLDDKEGIFKEFVHESCQRIAGTLKEEFAQFLPSLLPGILQSISAAAKFKVVEDLENEEASGESDEELQVVDDGTGGYRGIKTSQVQELLSSLETVTSFVQSVAKAYGPFVQQTAVTLLPLLDFEFDEEVRGEALNSWAEMIALSDASIARELMVTALSKLSKAMDEEQYDFYALEAQTRGLSDCLRRAPAADLLNGQEVSGLISLAVKLMTESIKRREDAKVEAEEEKEEGDEDEDGDEEEQNENVRIAICELIGSLMEKHTNAFLASGGATAAAQLVQRFLTQTAPAEDKSLALYIACDALEFLGSGSVGMWNMFMETLLNSVTDANAQLRQAACFGVNVAARIPEFSQFVPAAAQRLAMVLKAPNAKSKKNALATDNATAALGWLAEKQSAALGPAGTQEALSLWVDHLPLNEDEEEGKSSHAQLLRMVRANAIKADDMIKALKVFAQIWRKENCDELTNDGIVALFKELGQDAVAREAAKFTQKEKNQIGRIFEKANGQ